MSHHSRPVTRTFVHTLALSITYTLVISLCAPFAARRVEAAPVAPTSVAATNVQEPLHAKRDGELLVRFRDDVDEGKRNEIVTGRGAKRQRKLRGATGVEKVELAPGDDVQVAAQSLLLNPEVELAEPNYLVASNDITPNDTRFAEQWALANTGAQGGTVGADIQAPAAWATTTGTLATTVAVIDSGIDFTHPDLTRNRWTNAGEKTLDNKDDDHDGYTDDLHGWDFVAGTGTIADAQGHGTAVAGIIAAEGNNAQGTTGVMWRASLMSLRVLDHTGTGDVAAAVEAIDYATEHGAQVINLSWGLAANSLSLKSAIERAGAAGVVVVCSAGNTGSDIEQSPYYPASFGSSNIIAVAASDGFDGLTTWSNWGEQHVTVAAPGADILTTKRAGGYATMTGTSAAAPVVAGIAGLVKTVRPWLSASGTRAAVADGARQISGLEGKVSSGGVASAAGALAALQSPGTGGGDNGGNNGNGNGNGTGNGNGNGNGGKNEDEGSGNLRADDGKAKVSPHSDTDPKKRGRADKFRTKAPKPEGNSAGKGFLSLDEARRRKPSSSEAPALISADSLPICTGDCGGSEPPPGTGTDPDFGNARTDPENATGQPGVDLGSRNYNWSLPLVSLPGRAGHDLNLSLYYNSLLWTRQGNTVRFNSDRGLKGAPGFNLGLPKLQQQYWDEKAGTLAMMMVTPSGGHVQLRNKDNFGTFESEDGSYMQLMQPYKFISRKSNMVLNVDASIGMSNGAQVQQQPSGAGLNQQWYIIPTDSGYFRLVARHSAKSLDADGGTGKAQQWDYLGGWNQQWQFVPTTNGYNKIVARHNGQVLEVENASTVGGAAVQLGVNLAGTNLHQEWGTDYYASPDLTLRTKDGTQYKFVWKAGEWRCGEIKDRNGNFITASYDAEGRPLLITDTVGRKVHFIYENGYLKEIRQYRTGVTNTLAEFSYATKTAAHNFSEPGVTLYTAGAANGTPVPVLTSVRVPDGTRYDFNYTSYVQVNRITRYAKGGEALSYTSYNLADGTTSPQKDCPRFTEKRDWIWRGVMNESAEVLTTYAVGENEDGDTEWSQVTTPDGVTHKEFFEVEETAGWRKGLTTRTETRFGGAVKKYTETLWTQDDETLTYQKNPRPWKITVGDSEDNPQNKRITEIAYDAFSLPKIVSEYESNGTTLLRRTQTDYIFDDAYISRRIIGLPYLQTAYDKNNVLVSKTQYAYDWAQYPEMMQAFTNGAQATQHDSQYYGGNFFGRGNLVWMGRFDVNNPNAPAIETKMGYFPTGAVAWTRAHRGGTATPIQTNISYDDNYSVVDEARPKTFAYPTSVTDAEGFTAKTEYHYDLGAATSVQSPKPNATTPATANTGGPSQTITYEWAGRVLQVTSPDGAYTRYEYPDDSNFVKQYATVNGKTAADEVLSVTYFDGAGGVRAEQWEMPDSTTTSYAVHYMRDPINRQTWQSNPALVTKTGDTLQPTGEDTAKWDGGQPGGETSTEWKWTRQDYDWKGRPTLTTLPQTDPLVENATTLVTYDGCGCAGGEQTTVRDEAGRTKRYTKDLLGRLITTEEFNWDDLTSVYSTADYTYNGRDQLTLVRHLNNPNMDRTFEYDGYGRLKKKTTPEQGTTEYTYDTDGSVLTTKDARNVVTTFAYDKRGLATTINYATPSGVAATPSVTLTYDALGNRKQMTEGGIGNVAYNYDNLTSRLTSETRNFTGDAEYTLAYEYNYAGQLTKLNYPRNDIAVGYTRDKTGRVTAVTNTGYGVGNTPYVQNMEYRAFGAIKSQTYGNNLAFTAAFDNRLRATAWNVGTVMGAKYRYDLLGESSGRVTFASNEYDHTLDRSYKYDHVGRLVESHTGSEARAHAGVPNGNWNIMDGVYSHSYFYDERGNITKRTGWGGANPSYQAAQYNDKNQLLYNISNGSALGYDNAGNLTQGSTNSTFTYDATGQQVAAAGIAMTYDGDRMRVKRVEGGVTTYFIRSSVLGGAVIAEVAGGAVQRGYVYGEGGQLLALQQNNAIEWVHQDAVTKSQKLTNSAGAVTAVVELEPWGSEVAKSLNQTRQPQRYTSYIRDGNGHDDAMHRRYQAGRSRFFQPDPYDGSMSLGDPQSFNRYAYVQNDPVNFVDPSGLNAEAPDGGNQCREVDENGACIVRGTTDPFTLTGGAAVLALWNPIPYIPVPSYEPSSPVDPDPPNAEPTTEQKPPCPPVPDAPEGANLDQNIALALKWNVATFLSPMNQNAKHAWFANQVREHGVWDYKQQDVPGGRFIPFGNFNYGATGAAAGYSEGQLLRAAGWIQNWFGNSPGDGGSVNVINALTGRGGEAPFKDQRVDQENIKRGIEYYRTRFALGNCQ